MAEGQHCSPGGTATSRNIALTCQDATPQFVATSSHFAPRWVSACEGNFLPAAGQWPEDVGQAGMLEGIAAHVRIPAGVCMFAGRALYLAGSNAGRVILQGHMPLALAT